jgi:hypothetical protein
VTVESEITGADLASLRRHFWSMGNRRSKIYFVGLAVGLFPLLMIAVLLGGGHAPAESFLIVIVPAVVQVGLWTLLYRGLLRTFNSSFDTANAHVLGQHTLQITETGVRSVGPAGEAFLKWSAIERIYNEPAHVFIGMVGGQRYYIVPKRSFPNPSDAETFVSQATALRAATLGASG